jgi:uncharacterized protein
MRREENIVPLELSANEARVIGCLMEKSVITPEQYPLTLNSLVNACNQKSGRNPVMSLQPGIVQRTVRDLEGKHLVRVEENFKSRVEKYAQRFCNTRYSDFQFDPAQFAIVCLLLLRGPQTPGELRARSGRLHAFADNTAVVNALGDLMEREGEPLVVKLPRAPGRKDSEYMHLFSGSVDNLPLRSEPASGKRREKVSTSDLAERLSALEAEVAELRDLIKSTSRNHAGGERS